MRGGRGELRAVSCEELHRLRSTLKEQHAEKLHVKIVIPEDRGLSYSEASGIHLGHPHQVRLLLHGWMMETAERE
jgi:hypothetical protein